MKKDEKTYIELFPPEKQRKWGWPAIGNFILGGAGAGFHFFGFITTRFGNEAFIDSNTFLLKLLGPILVAAGFMFLPIEAGRPSRSFHLMRHVKRSWISREIVFYMIFLLAALIDYFSPSILLRLISVAGAVGLIISQGFIVYDSNAVTAWNRPAVPWYFFSSGIASGAGVALLLSRYIPIQLSFMTIFIAMSGIAANAIIWILYLFFPRQGKPAFRSEIEPLCRPVSLIVVLGFGHVLPLCWFLFYLAAASGSTGEKLAFYLTIPALLVLFGVSIQKVAMIRSASGKRSIGFTM